MKKEYSKSEAFKELNESRTSHRAARMKHAKLHESLSQSDYDTLQGLVGKTIYRTLPNGSVISGEVAQIDRNERSVHNADGTVYFTNGRMFVIGPGTPFTSDDLEAREILDRLRAAKVVKPVTPVRQGLSAEEFAAKRAAARQKEYDEYAQRVINLATAHAQPANPGESSAASFPAWRNAIVKNLPIKIPDTARPDEEVVSVGLAMRGNRDLCDLYHTTYDNARARIISDGKAVRGTFSDIGDDVIENTYREAGGDLEELLQWLKASITSIDILAAADDEDYANLEAVVNELSTKYGVDTTGFTYKSGGEGKAYIAHISDRAPEPPTAVYAWQVPKYQMFGPGRGTHEYALAYDPATRTINSRAVILELLTKYANRGFKLGPQRMTEGYNSSEESFVEYTGDEIDDCKDCGFSKFLDDAGYGDSVKPSSRMTEKVSRVRSRSRLTEADEKDPDGLEAMKAKYEELKKLLDDLAQKIKEVESQAEK